MNIPQRSLLPLIARTYLMRTQLATTTLETRLAGCSIFSRKQPHYKTPTENTAVRANFCLSFNCKFQKMGSGSTSIAKSVIEFVIAAPAVNLSMLIQ